MTSSLLNRRGVGLALASIVLLSGCAAHIKATRLDNPPPAEPYGHFGKIIIKPATLAPAFSEDGANQRALVKINENLTKRIEPAQTEWAKHRANDRTLVIEPVVSEIRFIGVGAAAK